MLSYLSFLPPVGSPLRAATLVMWTLACTRIPPLRRSLRKLIRPNKSLSTHSHTYVHSHTYIVTHIPHTCTVTHTQLTYMYLHKLRDHPVTHTHQTHIHTFLRMLFPTAQPSIPCQHIYVSVTVLKKEHLLKPMCRRHRDLCAILSYLFFNSFQGDSVRCHRFPVPCARSSRCSVQAEPSHAVPTLFPCCSPKIEKSPEVVIGIHHHTEPKGDMWQIPFHPLNGQRVFWGRFPHLWICMDSAPQYCVLARIS